MFYKINEGDHLKNGFNFLNDKSSYAIYFRVGRRAWKIRYSRNLKKWIYTYVRKDNYVDLPIWCKEIYSEEQWKKM